MSDPIYHPTSPETAARRKELAPHTHEAFEAFSRAVFAEGALTDAALFLYKNKRGYDLTRPGHKAEFAAVKRELCRVYSALAAQKGAASLKLRAAALRMGLPVFYAYTKMLSRR